MRSPLTRLAGPAVPFTRKNIDTDVIIRIERLTDTPRERLGPFAFEAIRIGAYGTPDPDCVFNQSRFAGAPILIAGANFGCGSSREGAVWALQGLGIHCVIAPSFGGIFANNCFQNGVLTITLPQETIDRLALIAEADSTAPFTVDLGTKTLTPPNETPITFEIETLKQHALLQGLDELGMTQTREAEIAAFESRDRRDRPWVHTVPHPSE